MRILIIEDEHYAAKNLKKLILAENPDAEILKVIDTVSESIDWFSSHVEPDLVFMDIQLADGLSFQIFEKVKINCPIIFTTAYDEYALNAFKVNSIDYLLKPLDQKELKKSLAKFEELYPNYNSLDWRNISNEILQPKENYKRRFLIKTGSSYAYLRTEEIALIFSDDGFSFAFTIDGKKVILDNSLDKISNFLDPNQFYRISRKHIVSLETIIKVHPYLNGRLKIEHRFDLEDDLIVSRDRAKQFKLWLDS